MQPLDQENILIQRHSNPEWFPKKLGIAKRRTTWFDLFLKSDIVKNESHILGPLTVAIAKKFKELIQKDEITIADLEGVGLEWLKKLDVSKPRSFERHMSKSAKPHHCFYNNDYSYLVDLSTEKKYTTFITKHYAARYYKEGIEDMIPKRWNKEVCRYHFEALNVMTSDDKEYEFSYADLPRLSVNDVEDIKTMIKNRVEDIQLGVERYQRTINLTKPTMFFKRIDQRIPFTMTATHKGVVYLNQYNIKSLIKLSEVKKFYDGTLVKIHENLIDMLSKNKLGSDNKRLKGRDWTDYDEMLGNYHGHSMSKGNIIKIFYHGLKEITQEVLSTAVGGIFRYKTPNQAYKLLEDKVLLKLDWAKNQKSKPSLKKTVTFATKGPSKTNSDKILARMDAMTIKLDAQYKELQSRAKHPTPDLDKDNMPMSHEKEAKFMQTFRKTRFYNGYRDQDLNLDNWHSSERNNYNRDNYRSNIDDKPYNLQIQFNDFIKSQQATNAFVKDTFIDLKTQLKTIAKNHQASIQNLETKFDRLADKQFGRPSGNNYNAYQLPQSRNDHVNGVFTRSGDARVVRTSARSFTTH
nr:reverse transcriptase domain-containing protein [Tanacetum cinerariifolium]